MVQSKLGLAAALALATSGAQALTITVGTFNSTEYANKTAGANWVIEDFEETPQTLTDRGNASTSPEGTLAGNLDSSLVGEFSSTGGSGSGSTCSTNNTNSTAGATGNCTTLARTEGTLNGQGNLVPDGGEWSLNSNDTTGIHWDAELDGGVAFTEIVFAIQDPADTGATVQISAGGVDYTTDITAPTIPSQPNGTPYLVHIAFSQAVTSADIKILNLDNRVNDAISFDGAAISAVPIPAAAWLFGSALVGMVGIGHRRRSRQA